MGGAEGEQLRQHELTPTPAHYTAGSTISWSSRSPPTPGLPNTQAEPQSLGEGTASGAM